MGRAIITSQYDGTCALASIRKLIVNAFLYVSLAVQLLCISIKPSCMEKAYIFNDKNTKKKSGVNNAADI